MRVQGWEQRLDEAVEAARDTPYRIGSHDCALFACHVVHALTGRDLVRELGLRYQTDAGALRAMQRIGGCVDYSLRAAVSAVLGPGVPVRRARRGDVLLLEGDTEPREHLGVCLGAQGCVLAPAGLAFLPLRRFLLAWRVD